MNGGTGSSLIEAEAQAGMSIEMKLDCMCPFFDRLYILLDERANVNPPMLGAVGIQGIA